MFISRKEFEKLRQTTNENNKISNENFQEIKSKLNLLLKSVHGDDAEFKTNTFEEFLTINDWLMNHAKYGEPLSDYTPTYIIEKVKKGEDKHTQIYPKLK